MSIQRKLLWLQSRGGGTGPADPASAGPIILAQLVNIHTNAHTKPYLPLQWRRHGGATDPLKIKEGGQ